MMLPPAVLITFRPRIFSGAGVLGWGAYRQSCPRRGGNSVPECTVVGGDNVLSSGLFSFISFWSSDRGTLFWKIIAGLLVLSNLVVLAALLFRA